MKAIYKSAEGECQIRQRYLAFLKHWPVPHQEIRVPAGQGETFVIASGPEDAPPLLLFHGGASNSAIWMGDVAVFARHFRVYAIDLIGEPGLSAPPMPTPPGWMKCCGTFRSRALPLWAFRSAAGSLWITRCAARSAWKESR